MQIYVLPRFCFYFIYFFKIVSRKRTTGKNVQSMKKNVSKLGIYLSTTLQCP